MPATLKLKGGTTAEENARTGALNELTVDEEAKQIRLHDAVTPGGSVIGGGGSTVTMVSKEWDSTFMMLPHNISNLSNDNYTESTPNDPTFTPAWFHWPTTVTSLAILVGVADAASTDTRVVIYEQDLTTGLPGAVLFASAHIDVSTTGRKLATLPAPLDLHGVYWFGIKSDSTTLGVSGSSQSSGHIGGNLGGVASNRMNGAVPHVGAGIVGAFTADPAVTFDNITSIRVVGYI